MADDGQYLAKLQDYYARHRVLPSYASIGSLIGLNSKASVAYMVLRLKSERFLESSPDRRLKPGKRFFERPLDGSVRAGFPDAAAQSAPETLSIDDFLVSHPSRPESCRRRRLFANGKSALRSSLLRTAAGRSSDARRAALDRAGSSAADGQEEPVGGDDQR